jgi:hypothetical protein
MLAGVPESCVPMVANLYADQLLNDRLQRQAGLDMAAVYRQLAAQARDGAPTRVWRLYMRTYEHLWRLSAGTLTAEVPPGMDADAVLLARLVRSFAGEWLRGARRYAVVLYPYLAEDAKAAEQTQTFVKLGLHDTGQASASAPGQGGGDGIPDGLVEIDESELGGEDGFDADIDDPLGAGKGRHGLPDKGNEDDADGGPDEGNEDDADGGPDEGNEDDADGGPMSNGDDADGDREGRAGKRRNAKSAAGKPADADRNRRSGGQCRQPFEYGALLRSLGLELSDHESTTRYYRERALPHLLPFPSRRRPRATEPMPEGQRGWEAGEALEDLDVLGSLLHSPHVIPGVTTVQRVYGEVPGSDPARVPMDLDIYIDCSGSMPNPAASVSYLTLCATILAMSALRAGAAVQATLWSSPGLFETTGGFLRDEKRVLGTVTGYVSGGTAFPIHILRDTYANRKPTDPPAHIVVISDDGADTMLRQDEKGNLGTEVCAGAIERARGGGTLVLNLGSLERWHARQPLARMGYRIHAVQAWEDLVAFARAFVRENYGDNERSRPP